MIPLLNVGWQTAPDYSLGERDTDVLSVINSEDLTVFTFDGLKRRLGLHPETLSRILARLEQEGLLTKEAHGYKVTPKITKLKLHEPRTEENHVPLLQTYLPSNVQIQHLIANLSGKWFGALRWFGLAENSRGVAMKWVTEDGGIQINATIADSTLTIEASWSFESTSDFFYCDCFGTEGSGSLNPFRIIKRMHGNLVNVAPASTETPQSLYRKSYENELKHWIGSLRGLHTVISTGDEAVHRMKIIDSIYKSAKRGKSVALK